ncbi:MAG: hypothetical protein EBZ48_06335 [Proteobacteria bacterium]|nr:hypothetical protein [Pseudomonadota bacterium]
MIAFLVPPSSSILRERIQARGPIAIEELQRRLQTAQKEYEALFATLSEPGLIDYFVVNDDRAVALSTLSSIYSAERARLARILPESIRGICLV